MKTIRKIACLILCLAFFVPALASCGKSEETPVATTAPASTDPAASEPEGTAPETEATTAAATTDKWEKLAGKVTMLSARDRQLKIELSEKYTPEKASRNDIYVKGPDVVEDGVTPRIQQMVYERNKAAYDVLQTTVEYVFWDYAWGTQGRQIEQVVKGNDPDAPDLFVNMFYDLGKAALNALLMDVWSIPGSFFDFDTEGWLSAWMQSMSFTGDRAYILGSDYFLDLMRAINVLPFNMTMMDANAAKLADAIIGADDDPLGTGEKLSTRFFDLVDEGNWTWDVLGKLCEAIWVDLDGDGVDSIRDQLGITADEGGGANASTFIYSCGADVTTERYKIEDPESPYNGQWWIKYHDTSENLNRIFDAVQSVFLGAGTLGTDAKQEGNSPDQPGIAYLRTKFAAGETLFAGINTLSGLEDDAFQTMEDLYSVVPCPTVDAGVGYHTVMDYTGDAGAINVNIGPRKVKTLTAFIQYCTERSPAIRTQFLQIVTKYKTTIYNQGTDRMLEIIYDGILYERDKMVDDMVMAGGGRHEDRWHVLLKKDDYCGAGSDYIAQQYEALRPSKQAILDNLMKKWYTLPKAGD